MRVVKVAAASIFLSDLRFGKSRHFVMQRARHAQQIERHGGSAAFAQTHVQIDQWIGIERFEDGCVAGFRRAVRENEPLRASRYDMFGCQSGG